MVVLTYIFKNLNISNDSRVSKRDDKSLNSQCVLDGGIRFKIYVFNASLFEETPNRSNSEIFESFLLWMFSPLLWRLSKSVLLLNKVDKRVGNELQSRCYPCNCKLDKSILKIVPKFAPKRSSFSFNNQINK